MNIVGLLLELKNDCASQLRYHFSYTRFACLPNFCILPLRFYVLTIGIKIARELSKNCRGS
jgi:hypothetical protein